MDAEIDDSVANTAVGGGEDNAEPDASDSEADTSEFDHMVSSDYVTFNQSN